MDHPPPPTPDLPPDAPGDLSHAGSVVDKAIEYMGGQGIAPISVASALLGGALGLMARTMDDRAIAGVLRNALASVEGGELRAMRDSGVGGGRSAPLSPEGAP